MSWHVHVRNTRRAFIMRQCSRLLHFRCEKNISKQHIAGDTQLFFRAAEWHTKRLRRPTTKAQNRSVSYQMADKLQRAALLGFNPTYNHRAWRCYYPTHLLVDYLPTVTLAGALKLHDVRLQKMRISAARRHHCCHGYADVWRWHGNVAQLRHINYCHRLQ